MKKIYIVRGVSHDETASYHHYYDVAFFTNKKEADECLKQCRHDGNGYWISEITTGNPF